MVSRIDDHEMQEGCGLDDPEFQIGLRWLIDNHFLDRAGRFIALDQQTMKNC